MNIREAVKDKKRIVIKIGSSSLMHNETGRLNLGKIEKLVRTIVEFWQGCCSCFIRSYRCWKNGNRA